VAVFLIAYDLVNERRGTHAAEDSPATLREAYNQARRLKILRGLTPYEFICQL
jgi:hypothetical protein